jgi:hypothetical protein
MLGPSEALAHFTTGAVMGSKKLAGGVVVPVCEVKVVLETCNGVWIDSGVVGPVNRVMAINPTARTIAGRITLLILLVKLGAPLRCGLLRTAPAQLASAYPHHFL